MRRRRIFWLGIILALVPALEFSEEKAGKDETVLRVETRLVEVNVVAQDAQGHAITNLTRDDFRLFDNRKQVPIDVFSTLTMESTPVVAALPPKTFSNRIQGGPPSVTVILLDGINTSFEDQTWARKEVVRFLEEIQPQDRVAIFLLGEHLAVLQNFTNDPTVLLGVLKKTKARQPKELAASAPPASTAGSTQPVDIETALQQLNASLPTGQGSGSSPSTGVMGLAAAANAQAEMEASMEEFETYRGAFFGVDRVARTMAALIAIANYLAQFPGRKNLIWVSVGFPISIGFDNPRAPGDTRDQIHFTPELQRAFKALNNADLAVYPVDARGLTASAPKATDMNEFYSTQGTMNEIADHTGGRAFFNTNDLARVMRSAVDDSHADYTLGFYPHDIRWDGKYHELKVTVTRPGVRLRYRKGYYAALEASKNEDETITSFNRALYSPLDSTGLGLTVTLEKILSDPRRAALRVVMDAHNLTFQDARGDKTIDLEMLFAQAGADGKVLNAFRQSVHMRIAGKGMSTILERGLTVGKWVGLVDGAANLELVVRDPATGNIGSVRIPLGT